MDKAEEGKKIILKRPKQKLMIVGIIIAIFFIVLLFVFIKGYSTAKEKYEDIISDLQEEIDSQADPVAVYETASKEVDIAVINAQIQNIGELATIEYLYTDAGKFEDPKKLFGKNIPFTTKSFIAKWDGVLKAGVDVKQIKAEKSGFGKEIVVYIPKAQILSHDIDSDSIETLDQKDGLFNAVKVEDVRAFDAVSKEAMEERAIEHGILDKALENAKKIIENLITSGKGDYNVKFELVE